MNSKQLFKPPKIKESLVIAEDQIEEYEERGYSIKLIKGQHRAYKELERWEEFETEIRKFLGILGFENVNKSPLNIGGHKIDAIGSCDNVFLIIEVKTRKEIRGNIRSELEKFNGWKSDIAKEIKRKYKNYIIKFIFCTDFVLDDNSKKFAKDNKIELWDSNYIKEYEGLYPILGDSTKYHILHELKCTPSLDEEFLVPAFRVRQRGRTIYNFFIEPEILLKIAYVFRRTSSQRERAYQRPLKSGRLERIRKFLEEEGGTFVNNIIINFKENLYFKPFKRIESGKVEIPDWLEAGILKLPNSYCCAEIIDGQHRTYGFTRTIKAKKEVKLPVVALDNASEIERATFFIKINKEQKPVDANLLWDLAGEIEPNTDAGIISNAVKILNKATPFKDLIYIPSEVLQNSKKPIGLANFCNGIEDRELINFIRPKNAENLYKILREYFLLIFSMFSYDWKSEKRGFICANAGVNVMLRILKRILIHKKGKIPSKREINKLFKPLSIYFKKRYYKRDKPNENKMSDLRKKCASEAGRGDVEKEFLEQISKTNLSYRSDSTSI